MAGYKIACKPVDRGHVEGDVEKNHSAMVVQLTNGSTMQEVARVGFDRTNTKNPTVSLKDQLDDVVGRARTAVDLLNDQLTDDGELL